MVDSITWWDDFMHVLNWIPWVMVAGFIARYRPLGRLLILSLAGGLIGAVLLATVLWQPVERLMKSP